MTDNIKREQHTHREAAPSGYPVYVNGVRQGPTPEQCQRCAKGCNAACGCPCHWPK